MDYQLVIKIKKYCILIFFLFLNMESFAGFHSLTANSRANCVNNESITWHANHYYWMRVISFHNYNHIQQHVIDTFQVFTCRAAAVCWAEAPKGQGDPWDVYAYHLMYDNWGKEYIYKITSTNDCDIYNGWWDE